MDKQEQTTTTAPDSTSESTASESKLNSAKQKLGALTEKAKQHDFKGDAKAAAEGAKALKESLQKHDFKAELKEAFAEAKKNPASIWKKPETPRPGKELAVAGLGAAIVLLLLLLVTSSSFIGLVCFVLGIGALLFSMLGLKTEGHKFAVGGSVVGLLVVFCSFGQIFGLSGGGASSDEQFFKKAGKANSVEEILEKAESAKKMESLNFFGFYTGMSYQDADTLRSHYGLNEEQMWFEWNKEADEVHGMFFTPKALTMVMDVANNFETVELAIQEYLGIVAWNNEKAIVQGEVDSIFQSAADKFVLGDAADVVRWYKTADGIVVRLFPKGWNTTGKVVFSIIDKQRMERDPAVLAQRAKEAEEKKKKAQEEYEKRAPARAKEQAWQQYAEKRADLLKQGKNQEEVKALGYGMSYGEWSAKYEEEKKNKGQ